MAAFCSVQETCTYARQHVIRASVLYMSIVELYNLYNLYKFVVWFERVSGILGKYLIYIYIHCSPAL